MSRNPPLSHDAYHRAGWKTLAEIIFPAGPNLEGQIQTWLFESLHLLGLQQGLLNKITRSAWEATAEMENPNSKEAEVSLIQLRVYTLPQIPPKSGTRRNWGFFRVKKRGIKSAESERPNHLVEFFLYLDGQDSCFNTSL
jgi:hypothetical protein